MDQLGTEQDCLLFIIQVLSIFGVSYQDICLSCDGTVCLYSESSYSYDSDVQLGILQI